MCRRPQPTSIENVRSASTGDDHKLVQGEGAALGRDARANKADADMRELQVSLKLAF
jgi:hypothetical protein